MVQRVPKYSTETVTCSVELLHIAQRLSNVPCSPYLFHRDCQMFQGAAKYSTDLLNIPQRLSNVPQKTKYSTGTLKCSIETQNVIRRLSNVPRGC